MISCMGVHMACMTSGGIWSNRIMLGEGEDEDGVGWSRASEDDDDGRVVGLMQMRSADMNLVVNGDLVDDEEIELATLNDADEIAGSKDPKRVMMTVKARAQALEEANRRRNGMWLCIGRLGPASLIRSAGVWRQG
jgi:hypothetical protein